VRIRFIAVAGIALVATACPAHHASPKAAPSSAALATGTLQDGAPGTYLAIEYNREPARILQLRSSTDGHLIRELYHSTGPDLLSAVRAPNGTIFVFTFQGETTVMSKIDPASGKLETVRTFSAEVNRPSFNAAGDKLAYLTYPPSYHTTPGLIAYLPYELAVLDLKTGKQVSTTTDQGGHPFFSVVWSPDGTKIAATYAGDGETVLIFDAAHPSFRAARRITAPPGCSFSVSAWIRAGLMGSETCGKSPVKLPRALVEFSAGGKIIRTWPLPQCAYTASAITDPSAHSVLVFVRSGSGGDTWCERHFGHYVYELAEGKLRLISRHIEHLDRYLHDGVPVTW